MGQSNYRPSYLFRMGWKCVLLYGPRRPLSRSMCVLFVEGHVERGGAGGTEVDEESGMGFFLTQNC